MIQNTWLKFILVALFFTHKDDLLNWIPLWGLVLWSLLVFLLLMLLTGSKRTHDNIVFSVLIACCMSPVTVTIDHCVHMVGRTPQNMYVDKKICSKQPARTLAGRIYDARKQLIPCGWQGILGVADKEIKELDI